MCVYEHVPCEPMRCFVTARIVVDGEFPFTQRRLAPVHNALIAPIVNVGVSVVMMLLQTTDSAARRCQIERQRTAINTE